MQKPTKFSSILYKNDLQDKSIKQLDASAEIWFCTECKTDEKKT